MRSEPLACAGSVSTATPPAAVTAAAIASSAQATTTGPTPASMARRQTWTIMGTPWMSASGLSGSRVEARRAGIITIGWREGTGVAAAAVIERGLAERSEEHTSELQSLMRNSYAVFCLQK